MRISYIMLLTIYQIIRIYYFRYFTSITCMVFDYNTTTEKAGTTFDGNSTTFFSPVIQSGVVYTYDYLPSNSLSVTNPGKFIFGQQIETNAVSYLDQFGYAVSYNSGVLVATAPGEDFEDSTLSEYGAAYLFENPTRRLAWEPIAIQQPVVDIRLLTSVYMYDRISSAKSQFFDFFNPLQGKVLGAAQENIDFISAIDPASYNVGPVNNRGDTWATAHVGEVWWNISTVRFIDPNQDNPTYAAVAGGKCSLAAELMYINGFPVQYRLQIMLELAHHTAPLVM